MVEKQPRSNQEDGIEIPYQQINSETLDNMIQEFVTRDGSDWADTGCSLEEKVEQVLRQLRDKKVRIVYDQRSESANIVVCG